MEAEGFHLLVDFSRDSHTRQPGLPLIILCINASTLQNGTCKCLDLVQSIICNIKVISSINDLGLQYNQTVG